MPTYEYLCEKCQHEFEREQRISDPPIKTCPKCRSRKVTKLISRTSFVLKGGGWYSDLYSSTSGKSDADKNAPSSGDLAADSTASASDASKTETAKPEASKNDAKPAESSKRTSKPKSKSGSSKKSAA